MTTLTSTVTPDVFPHVTSVRFSDHEFIRFTSECTGTRLNQAFALVSSSGATVEVDVTFHVLLHLTDLYLLYRHSEPGDDLTAFTSSGMLNVWNYAPQL